MARKFYAAMACAVALAGCAGSRDSLGRDAFAGAFRCDGVPVTLTSRTIEVDGAIKRISAVEEGGNVDFGFTMTDGSRFSIFDLTATRMTLFDHRTRETYDCRRV